MSAPRDFLRAEDPHARGFLCPLWQQPESLAAVAVAKELVHNVKFLNITCAPEGKLAVESADDPNALTLLIPRANDKGLRHDRFLFLHDPALHPYFRHCL